MTQDTRSSFSKWIDRVKTLFSTPFRESWDRKIEYILSCVGYCVGFGSIWRFPYVVYKNGGGAFFLPYTIVVVLLVLPIFFLECILGQFSGCNPVACFNFAPAFKGIGIAMSIIVFIICIYYAIFLVYSTKFIFASLCSELPWTKCDPAWGANSKCLVRITEDNATLPLCSSLEGNFTVGVDCQDRQSVAEQYWTKAILHSGLDDEYNIENLGTIQMDLFGILLITSIIIYLSVIRGIKSSGKITYFTATFPMIMLVVFLAFAFQLKGSTSGLYYLFNPQWNMLINIDVWAYAITQAFYTTGICMGCLTLYSSYNDFHHRLHWSVLIIIVMEFFASLCSSMTVFCILGFLADLLNIDIDKVVNAGPGLIFVLMPEAIAKMPIPQLWSVLFFFMLYTVGVDSQSVMVDTVVTNIYEEIAPLRKKKAVVRIVLCVFLFLFGIPLTLNGGIYLVDFLDFFCTNNTLVFLALCEVIAISYFYGINKYIKDTEFMLNFKLNIYWKVCWIVFVPILLWIFLVSGSISAIKTACNKYSKTVCILGWLLTLFCVLPVPLWAMYELYVYSKTEATWKGAFKPDPKWGPRNIINKVDYLDWKRKQGIILDPNTALALKDLDKEVSPNFPDVKAVMEKRIKERKFNVIRLLEPVLHFDVIEELERESPP